MRNNIAALAFTDGRVPPDLTRPAREPREPPGPVSLRQVPPEAVTIALALAHGDSSRLSFLPDGTVLVSNRPRPANRTQETRR